MPTIKKNHIVQKRNVLNELRANNMTLQELRFFSIYLSKINAKDINTRVVRFSIADFQSIMELGRLKNDYLKQITNRLLSKVVNIPNDRGGYSGFQLFKECRVDQDENLEWYIEIDAHDKALPLMFEFRDRYFSYQLWNALRLRSSNQLRMYEILKQYEKIGSRIISVVELKDLLGIEQSEYGRFQNFKKWVLDVCQQALEDNTDIKFTYAPHGKKGPGGKILFLKFIIEKNENYIDQLTLFEFIEEQNQEQEENESPYEERLRFLATACLNEFTETEIGVLLDEMKKILPFMASMDDLQCHDYLSDKYHELAMRAEKTKIHNRFGYLRRLIFTDDVVYDD